MKRLVALSAVMFLCGTAVFAGSSSITITAPQYSGTGSTAGDDALNLEIRNQFKAVQTNLNADYFSNFHDQTDLARGFANSSAVTRDNASLMGFQNYDLFCVMLGGNMGFAYPSMSITETKQAFKDIKNKGDVYAGINTGGFAGQVGVNASFLYQNLYLSAKFGSYSFRRDFGDTAIDISQTMFGVGANYKLLSEWDFAWGLAKWRGISLGTGFVYNSSNVKVNVKVDDQHIAPFTVGAYTLDGDVTNIGARLAIDSSSFVIPLEATTSVQALWLFNFGFGAGVDVIIPTSTIKLGGNASTNLNGTGSLTQTSAGSVKVVGTDSENKLKFTDVFAPRLAADMGLNISVVKIDLAANWYPFTKAVALGLSAGVVW
jgi:hypothetical protein